MKRSVVVCDKCGESKQSMHSFSPVIGSVAGPSCGRDYVYRYFDLCTDCTAVMLKELFQLTDGGTTQDLLKRLKVNAQ